MRSRLLRLSGLLAVLALPVAVGCTEEGLTGVEGVEPPGKAAEARSVSIPVDQLPLWRDTSYSGFATIRDVPYMLAADDPPLRSRALFSLDGVPDSVEGQAVDTVASMVLRVVADTLRSRFSGDSATLRLFSLERDFTLGEVSWQQAADGSPWATPGGDLGARLADLTFRMGTVADSLVSDTLRMPFAGDPDSLISAWGERGSVPPLALLLEGEGTRLAVSDVSLEIDARNAEMDSLEQIVADSDTSTFIHDPDLPDVGRRLRLGGLPSSRFYAVFRPPDSIQGVSIRGARVNRAELVFHPVSEPGGAFRPPFTITTLASRLLADPFRFGPRTPIGDPIGQRRVLPLDPDSLGSGRPLRIRVTDLVQTWASAPEDSIQEFRIGVRPVPDGQDLGFWDFGSSAAAEGLRPVLRILITPPTDFSLP